MGYVNKLTVLGRLGRDPELHYGQNGTAVCRMSVATNSTFPRNGVKVTETEWHNIVTFGKRAEVCAQWLKKGREVFVEGPIRTRSWIDTKTKEKRERKELIATDVQFIGSAPAKKSGEATPTQQAGEPGYGGDDANDIDTSVLDAVPTGEGGSSAPPDDDERL